MNHTERIAETARRHRHLTRRLVKEAVETYFDLLADDLANGEWVDLYGIAKVQVVVEAGSGAIIPKGMTNVQEIKRRLRTKARLFDTFKKRCYCQIMKSS